MGCLLLLLLSGGAFALPLGQLDWQISTSNSGRLSMLTFLKHIDNSVTPAEATPDVAPISDIAPFFAKYEDDDDDLSEQRIT